MTLAGLVTSAQTLFVSQSLDLAFHGSSSGVCTLIAQRLLSSVQGSACLMQDRSNRQPGLDDSLRYLWRLLRFCSVGRWSGIGTSSAVRAIPLGPELKTVGYLRFILAPAARPLGSWHDKASYQTSAAGLSGVDDDEVSEALHTCAGWRAWLHLTSIYMLGAMRWRAPFPWTTQICTTGIELSFAK